MAKKRARDVGAEILDGLREIKRGEVGRVSVRNSVNESLDLPPTDSIEELARFWDSHEVTEFEDQLEEVSEQVFQSKCEVATGPRPKPDNET
jgi:hypothetical protein